MILTKKDKVTLLLIARRQIEKSLGRGYKKQEQESFPEGLKDATCGAFVSLYIKNKLRGCMGTFSETDKLVENVRRMSRAAASSDSRFNPIDRTELDDLEIEISVLSPRRRISGPEEIEIGKHGVYIQKDGFRGTLLPQVAVNQNWHAEEFLRQCARSKAGLDWEEWREAEIYTYEATVFRTENPDSNNSKYT